MNYQAEAMDVPASEISRTETRNASPPEGYVDKFVKFAALTQSEETLVRRSCVPNSRNLEIIGYSDEKCKFVLGLLADLHKKRPTEIATIPRAIEVGYGKY